ncbi:M23 family metallopeptidase, partial [candidate division KSB1 bacterium]|nr:M23 family metallopeptidase [candidate division KSB1 bacterium]
DPDISIELSTLVPVIPVRAEGQSHLVYELVIQNQSGQLVVITKVEIFDGNSQIAVYEDNALADRLTSNSTTLCLNAEKVVFLWLKVDSNNIPLTLVNRVTFESPNGGPGVERELQVEISTKQPVVLGPPMKGEKWFCANISNSSHHRLAVLEFDGVNRIPQRFAIDWAQTGSDGQTYSGDRLANSNYHAYGAEILAVADGMVAKIQDGIAENIPGDHRAVPITLDTAGGNYVLLDLGNNQFALYAHLIPGSIRVQAGVQVKRGDVIGLLGNSGNSTEPHLHFHISKVFDTQRNSGLNGIGLPFVFELFTIQGNSSFLGDRQMELPIEDAIIRFPDD